MTDRPRYDDLSDDQLESLIRGLPARQPSAALRRRILSHADQRRARRLSLPRPALALAALLVLFLADLMVIASQNAGLAVSAAPAAIARAHTSVVESDRPAWLSEMGAEELGPRIAQMVTERLPNPPTYYELTAELLQTANGG